MMTAAPSSMLMRLDDRLGALGQRRRTGLLLSLALVTRLGYLLLVADQPLRSDAQQYHRIATNLAEGRGFADTFPQIDLHATGFRPPLYPGLLGAVYRVLWPSPGIGRLLSVALGVAVVWAVHRLLGRVTNRTGAFAGAVVLAVYPPLVANDTVTLTEPLSLLLLVVFVDLLLQQRWAFAGIAGGLEILTRSSARGLVVVVAAFVALEALAAIVRDTSATGSRRAAWIHALGPRAAWRAVRPAAVIVGTAALSITPWLVRNEVRLGAPVLGTSNGFNLAAMYSPEAQDSGHWVDPVQDPRFEDFRLAQFDEVVWDRELSAYALRSLRDDPTSLMRVSARNTLAIFELRPSYNTSAEALDGRDPTVRDLGLPMFWAVTVAGFVGLWRSRARIESRLFALVGVYFTALSIVLIAPPRLRSPFDLVCCLGVGLLVGALVERSPDATAPAVGGTAGAVEGSIDERATREAQAAAS